MSEFWKASTEELAKVVAEKDAEIDRLRAELEAHKDAVEKLKLPLLREEQQRAIEAAADHLDLDPLLGMENAGKVIPDVLRSWARIVGREGLPE